MPTDMDSDHSIKMIKIDGAEKTIGRDIPYKKVDDIEGEIN